METLKKDELKEAFLEAYPKTANVQEACHAAGISRKQHYTWLQDDPLYAARYKDAQAAVVDSLEKEAIRRARDGYDEPVYYKGAQVGEVRKFSDLLLIFLLKGLKPEVYRERVQIDTPDVVANVIIEAMRQMGRAAGLALPEAAIEGESREIPADQPAIEPDLT